MVIPAQAHSHGHFPYVRVCLCSSGARVALIYRRINSKGMQLIIGHRASALACCCCFRSLTPSRLINNDNGLGWEHTNKLPIIIIITIHNSRIAEGMLLPWFLIHSPWSQSRRAARTAGRPGASTARAPAARTDRWWRRAADPDCSPCPCPSCGAWWARCPPSAVRRRRCADVCNKMRKRNEVVVFTNESVEIFETIFGRNKTHILYFRGDDNLRVIKTPLIAFTRSTASDLRSRGYGRHS